MTVFVAFLRAVNVGGTGKIAMADLRALAEKQGFRDVSTYIQSGNLVFRTDMDRSQAHEALNSGLADYFGATPGAFLRTCDDLRTLCARNPFPDADPKQVAFVFLPEDAPPGALETMVAPDGEQAVALGSEIVVHYPKGMGRSKFKLPALKPGTARNLNTVRALLEIAGNLAGQ